MSLIIDGSNGLTFPNSTVQASAGSVLQVIQANTTTAVTTTSTSFVTTGLTLSITPKFTTSKILILCNVRAYVANASASENFAIFRNSTNLTGAVGYSLFSAAASNAPMQSFQWLDSPATTSSTTYTLYMASPSAITVGVQADGSVDFPGTITLMEIAG